MKAYEHVYNQIEERIASGLYVADELLPSEKDLREEFGVSRDTIRKALSLLMSAGFIQKIQGKGSLVLKRQQLNFPVSGLTSYKELQNAQGFSSKTRVVTLKKVIADIDLAAQTGFELGTELWYLIRTREIDGKKVVLDKDWVTTSAVPYLDTEIAEDSIYRYFEHRLKLEIAYADKEITIDGLTIEDRDLLDLNPHDINIVSIKSRVHLSDTTQFQYTESRHQVDKFRFHDFARRKIV
jgi:GntR family trehalose operon transcriptional repressor